MAVPSTPGRLQMSRQNPEETLVAQHPENASPENSPQKKKPDKFSQFASQMSLIAGHPLTFVTALGLIIVWAILGPVFHYHDTWQLVINTTTTIITFLMVFIIQNSQNRDSQALHLKLDELIRTQKEASNSYIDIEDLSQDELQLLKEKKEGVVSTQPAEL